MLEQIPDLPPNVLGFSAKGVVSAQDYQTVVIPAVEAAFAGQKKVRFLYHIGAEFTRFEIGAMWEDARIGLEHLTGWERVAVVTDIEWLRTAVHVFGLAIPHQVRVFRNAEIDAALKWIAAD